MVGVLFVLLFGGCIWLCISCSSNSEEPAPMAENYNSADGTADKIRVEQSDANGVNPGMGVAKVESKEVEHSGDPKGEEYDEENDPNTKTRITRNAQGEIINHLDIKFNIEQGMSQEPLEIDENEMPLSATTEKVFDKKLMTVTERKRNSFKQHRTDDDLNNRSFVISKPKVEARRETRI